MRRLHFFSRLRSSLSYDAFLAGLSAHDSHRRRKIATRSNQRYAEIERLRSNPDGTTTFLSADLGLTMREWHEQNAVLDGIPRAWWVPVVDLLRSRPVRSQVRAARRTVQRARRGWDDSVLWGLDHHLCKTLGMQLAQMATVTHSWPDHLCDSFQEWKQLLIENSNHLLAYSSGEALPEEQHLDELSADPDADQGAIDEATYAAAAARQATVTQAQAALHWVADVLPALWD
jgi:hypothetical protein